VHDPPFSILPSFSLFSLFLTLSFHLDLAPTKRGLSSCSYPPRPPPPVPANLERYSSIPPSRFLIPHTLFSVQSSAMCHCSLVFPCNAHPPDAKRPETHFADLLPSFPPIHLRLSKAREHKTLLYTSASRYKAPQGPCHPLRSLGSQNLVSPFKFISAVDLVHSLWAPRFPGPGGDLARCVLHSSLARTCRLVTLTVRRCVTFAFPNYCGLLVLRCAGFGFSLTAIFVRVPGWPGVHYPALWENSSFTCCVQSF